MSRRRRRIESQKCYEVCFRAREGLPFVCYHLINLIICSVVARVQRDQKVILCHDIWNGSHVHLLLVALDADRFFAFLGEVQKQITEIIKRLLGKTYLNIWEGSPMVALVLDLDKAVDRISYFYANPGQDNLVESIEQFPGVSSWNDFKRDLDTVDSSQQATFPWLRLPSIPLLSSASVSHDEDLSLVKFLKSKNKKRHSLVRNPNGWMKCFGVQSNEEVRAVNQRILDELRRKELIAREKRQESRKTVIGAARLKSQQIMKPHTPKKRSRKIFCLCSDPRERLAFIFEFNAFCARCAACYQRWKAGDFSVEWPPGAFRPPIPPLYNIFPLTSHF